MSARSQRHAADAEKSLNLAPALRDCLSPGVVIIHPCGHIVSATPEAGRLLGLPVRKATLAPLSVLPAALRSLVQEVFARQQPAVIENLPLHSAGRPEHIVHAHAQMLATDSNPAQVLLVLSDVTGFRQLEQTITRLDRLATVGTLSTSIAHEIKNALVAVKTFVDLLLEQNKDVELANIVGRELNRVNTIVRQMLKFGGPASSRRATVRLHDVLEHSLRMVQHQLDGKLISIHRAFNAAPDAVEGDDRQLEQVFVNLFLNAIEATGDNGTLTVATELLATPPPEFAAAPQAVAPHVRVIVADTGTGIAPEHLDRMFEPFFTTKNHGTGLGLPITRRIVQEHNGQITVHSKPQQGTTFSLLFPVGNQAR